MHLENGFPAFAEAPLLLLVIPAKAGIQLNTAREALDIGFLCASHSVFHWIPAFAGMTSTNVGIPQDLHPNLRIA